MIIMNIYRIALPIFVMIMNIYRPLLPDARRILTPVPQSYW